MGAVPRVSEFDTVQPKLVVIYDAGKGLPSHREREEERKSWMSYISEDKKSCRLRYIHEAAIDMVSNQGIWNICGRGNT
jgi:hypothetical protein